ncbi:MAG: hypothetical protein ABIC19_01755 [Patescibacteria group bacterium]|nr:hypothetical protein [Patescibacteria group bacterium]
MNGFLVAKNRIKRFLLSEKFLVIVLLIILPIAGFLAGKTGEKRMSNPSIVIDTSEVECDCPVCEKEEIEPEIQGQGEESKKSGQGGNEEAGTANKGGFVASKNGEKYYPVDCGLVSRIKEENKVYYDTEDEAMADGKQRTSGCK